MNSLTVPDKGIRGHADMRRGWCNPSGPGPVRGRRHGRLIAGMLLLLGLAACDPEAQPSSAPVSSLTWLRVGLLPTDDRERLMETHTPLINFISQELGIPYRILVAEDYDDGLRLFGAGMVDLADFEGMGFVRAHREHGARPLVMREVDARFTSVFLARPGEGDEVADFRGKTIAFGSEHSTSGHWMPRYFLKTILEIEPETVFDRVNFSGQHDRTALMVQAGEADLGVVDGIIARRMWDDGRLNRDKVHLLWETPTYPNHVWVVPRDMGESDRHMILNAFLKLSWEEEGHHAILERLGSKGYLPASVSDFAMLGQVAAFLGVEP